MTIERLTETIAVAACGAHFAVQHLAGETRIETLKLHLSDMQRLLPQLEREVEEIAKRKEEYPTIADTPTPPLSKQAKSQCDRCSGSFHRSNIMHVPETGRNLCVNWCQVRGLNLEELKTIDGRSFHP